MVRRPVIRNSINNTSNHQQQLPSMHVSGEQPVKLEQKEQQQPKQQQQLQSSSRQPLLLPSFQSLLRSPSAISSSASSVRFTSRNATVLISFLTIFIFLGLLIKEQQDKLLWMPALADHNASTMKPHTSFMATTTSDATEKNQLRKQPQHRQEQQRNPHKLYLHPN